MTHDEQIHKLRKDFWHSHEGTYEQTEEAYVDMLEHFYTDHFAESGKMIDKGKYDFASIEVGSPLFRNIITEACIEFGKWYSGMDGMNVRNAYKRFREEVYNEINEKEEPK